MKRQLNPSLLKAAALKYQDDAPKVVAKGQGEIAKKILENAKKFDVNVFQNAALANSLLDVEVGQQIPAELFQAVAEVFVWLIKSEEKTQISGKF